MNREPPSWWRFREGTHDREIWRCVVECDEYRMEKRKIKPTDVIFDIGAHTGAFTFLAEQTGADVWPYEASEDNYRILVHNLDNFDGVTCAAVWRSDDKFTDNLPFQPSTNAANTGGGDVFGGYQTVRAYPFDVCINPYLDLSEQHRIRLVKLDCEYSEFPILLTSKRLHLIDEIIGEYHELPYNGREIPDYARVDGVEAFTRDVLRECLERNGFEVEMNHEAENIGKFFAVRT